MGQLEGKHGHDKLTTGAWNPHQNCQQYATANEHQVRNIIKAYVGSRRRQQATESCENLSS